MFRKSQSIPACGLLACILIVGVSIPTGAQGTSSNHHVIPRFSSALGSELLLTNLSSRLVSAAVRLIDTQGSVIEVLIPIQPGTNGRLSAGSFGLGSFEGTVVVDSSAPLSVMATLGGPGGIETVGPATSSNNLIVPFASGMNGLMKLSIFNEEPTTTSVVITAVAANGSPIATVQRIIPTQKTLIESVEGMFPRPASAIAPDISHLTIRTASNVFGTERRIYAQAESLNFLDTAQGIIIPTTDFAAVSAVPASSAIFNGVIPFFAQGSDYVSIVQIINTSNAAASVTLRAIGTDGNLVAGTDAVTLEVPANGAVRRSVRNIFNLPAGLVIGSIDFQSTTPVVVTEAIASETQGGFVLLPTAGEPNANFAFSVRQFNDQFFNGFTFVNPGSTPARLTVRNVSDVGAANSRVILTLNPFSSLTRSLVELLPEARTASLVHISSNVPILASGLEGRFDNSSLARLPAIRPQDDFIPPDPTKFLVTGTVLHNGVPFPGVNIQLSGPVNVATTTDVNGVFFFQETPAGTYSLRIVANGYTFSPASRTVTISTDSSRGNDFAATLITPTITLVQPPSVVAGSGDTSIFVVASPLTESTEIVFEGSPVVTSISTAAVPVTVAGATGGSVTVIQQTPALKTVLSAATLAVARAASLFVRTNGPGGSASSASVPFVIGGPAPVLTSMTGVPDPLLIGNPGFTITVNGAGFSSATVLQVGGVSLATTFVSSTQLRAFVPPALLGEGGLLRVTALNPSPTVGPSNELTVSLFNPIPGLTSISPNSVEVRLDPNSLPLVVTVNGFGFSREAVVTIDGQDVPTEYRSSILLIASIPQKLLESPKITVIAVKNPAPTLGTSEALPLSLYNLVPTVTSVEASPILYDPTPRFLGDEPAFPGQVIIRGTNFATELIYVFSTPCDDKVGGLSGTRVSSTMVVGAITIACTGVYSLGITNPQPGGGLSNLMSFTVSQYTAPPAVSISGISPVAIGAGSAAITMTISGTNFVSGAVVNFGTAVLFPTSVTSNAIVVTIPAFLLRSSGIVPVSITNPNVTGNSNRILFTIN